MELFTTYTANLRKDFFVPVFWNGLRRKTNTLFVQDTGLRSDASPGCGVQPRSQSKVEIIYKPSEGSELFTLHTVTGMVGFLNLVKKDRGL